MNTSVNESQKHRGVPSSESQTTSELNAYAVKKSKSPKLKSPLFLFYDDKGAAFTVAPFGDRVKDVESKIAMLAAAPALHSALMEAEKLIARYEEALDDCGQFLGGDQEAKDAIRAALASSEDVGAVCRT